MFLCSIYMYRITITCMQLKNLCVLAQKKAISKFVDFIMRGSTWGCGYPYLKLIIFVQISVLLTYNRMNIMLYTLYY